MKDKWIALVLEEQQALEREENDGKKIREEKGVEVWNLREGGEVENWILNLSIDQRAWFQGFY